MEQQTQKKEWKTPELIVLVRNKLEETVLTYCKSAFYGSGPNTHDGACTQTTDCWGCAVHGTGGS